MILLPISLIAGALTILSPCVFPLLPIIFGSSLPGSSRIKPYIIILSLTVSIVFFTLLLKVSTLLLSVPSMFWSYLSGIIIIFLSISFLFPNQWIAFSAKIGFQNKTSTALQSAGKKEGVLGAILIGFSLGPVFTSCSPTFAYILATVLPQNFIIGLANLFGYSVGLTGLMLVIALFGKKAVSKFRWALDEKGIARKIMGILFLIVGIAIFTRLDKVFEIWLLDIGFFDITGLEDKLFGKHLN